MIGSFVVLITFLAIDALGITWMPLALLVMLLASMLFTSVYGWTVERIAYRPLRSSPRLAPLISAIGMSIFLQNYIQILQGARSKPLQPILPGNLTLMDQKPQDVAHPPCRRLADAECFGQTDGRDALVRLQNEPQPHEPGPQGQLRSMQRGSCRHGELEAAVRIAALIKPRLEPSSRVAPRQSDRAPRAAGRTESSVRPHHRLNLPAAQCLVARSEWPSALPAPIPSFPPRLMVESRTQPMEELYLTASA